MNDSDLLAFLPHSVYRIGYGYVYRLALVTVWLNKRVLDGCRTI